MMARGWRFWAHLALLALGLAWGGFVCARYFTRLWHPLPELADLILPLWQGGVALPFLRDALLRSTRAVAAAVVLWSAALLLGMGISRLFAWQYRSRAELVFCGMGLGMAVLMLLGLGLVAGGYYRPVVLRVATGLALFIGFQLARHARFGAARGRAPGGSRRLVAPNLAARRQHLFGGSLGLVVAVCLVATWVAALAPPTAHDAVWYQLYFPRLFLEAGRLVDLPAMYPSLYPMLWNVWFGYGLALGGPVAAVLLHWMCLPLTMLVIWGAVTQFVPAASPRMAVGLFATIPVVMWEASVAYLDLALAFYLALAVYAVLALAVSGRGQYAVLAAVACGVALATKHLAIGAVVVIGPLAVWRLAWSGQRPLRVLLWVVGIVAGALLIAVPWYLRSWQATGDPVFPVGFQWFGASDGRWDAVSESGLQGFMAGFGRPRTPWNLLTLPWDLTMHAVRYAGLLGPVFLLACPLVVFCRWWRRGQVGWVLALTLGYGAVWASPLSSFQARWLLPAAPWLAVLAAAGITRLAALARSVGGPRLPEWLAAAVALIALCNVPWLTPVHEREGREITHTLRGVPLDAVLGGVAEGAYLEASIPTYAAWQALNERLDSDAVVLAYSEGDELYARARRIPALSTQAREAAFAAPNESGKALAALRKLEITHVVMRKTFLAWQGFGPEASWEQFALTRRAGVQAWYETIYEDEAAVAYRIRWEALTSASTPAATGTP